MDLELHAERQVELSTERLIGPVGVRCASGLNGKRNQRRIAVEQIVHSTAYVDALPAAVAEQEVDIVDVGDLVQVLVERLLVSLEVQLRLRIVVLVARLSDGAPFER